MSFFAPQVSRVGYGFLAITIQSRLAGDAYESDWNEITNFPEQLDTFMYFINLDYVLEPPTRDE